MKKILVIVLLLGCFSSSAFADIYSRINKNGMSFDDDKTKLIVLQNGNVGIGLLTPTVAFEVTGNVFFNGPVVVPSVISVATAVDFSNGPIQLLTVSASSTQAISFVNPSLPTSLILLIRRNVAVTLPGNIRWKNGITPVFGAPASGFQFDIIGLIFDGTNYYGEANLDF